MKNELYLVAFYSAQPKDPRKTKVKGYMNDPENISYVERVEFAKKLKSRDLTSANVILDLRKMTVVKNLLNAAATFDDTVKYYCEAYPTYMQQVGFTLEETKDESTDVQAVQAEEEKSS
jgi:hypothetical protein